MNAYFDGEKDKEFIVESMRKYVAQEQEIDKVLKKLITPYLHEKSLRVLDAACGNGHVIEYLSRISPESHFVGVDITSYLIDEARKVCEDVPHCEFVAQDVMEYGTSHVKEFDISISWKTLSWLPTYTEMFDSLLAMTKSHIFISSLFYDGDIDFEIRVREYKKEGGKDVFNSYYNVYSLPHFIKYAKSHGATHVEVTDFEIPIDLPRGDKDVMGTYTLLLNKGKRVQISGAVVMSWKILRIDV